MDVELSDGVCFEIFKQIEVKAKVIMTTAYDSYALKAFEVGGVDYLLKPIEAEPLKRAVARCRMSGGGVDVEGLLRLIGREQKSSVTKEYKERYIVRFNDRIVPLNISDIAYIYAEEKNKEEALIVCKDRAVINVDHGYKFYDEVLVLLDKHNMHDQVLIKGKEQPATVQAKLASYKKNMLYMPIVDLHKEGQMDYLQAHLDSFPCIAYELCWKPGYADKFEKAAKDIVKAKSKVWVNTLWASLCGGLDDDLAAESPENVEKVYGYMVKHGATLIQTDRPAQLIGYLRSKGLHD